MDLRPLHREALADLDGRVAAVAVTDLQRPTPCAGWTVADLLAHQLGQHRGFAAAVSDGDAPPSAYAPVPYAAQAWTAASSAVREAFAAADPDATVLEVELSPRPLPVRVLVGAQLLDTAVHCWDLARSLGGTYAPRRAVVAAVAAVADPIVDDDRRVTAGFFGRAIGRAVDRGQSPWDRVLAHLGRDPGWTAP